MSFERLMPIERLRPGATPSAPAGSLLVPYGSLESLSLRFDIDGTKLALPLDARKERAFATFNIANQHLPALILEDWALRVDPDSGYNTFEASPKAGDAIITVDDAGFVGMLDHTLTYVTTKGGVIAQPNWSRDQFIGFRRWSVGYQEAGRWIDLLPLQDLAD